MLSALKVCSRICLFSKGPQDIPASIGSMLGISICAVIVMVFIDEQLGQRSHNVVLLESIILLGLYGFIGLVLYVTNKSNRFVQSITAIIGIELVIYSVFLLITLVFLPLKITIIIALASIVLYLWRLSIICHIFKEMLSTDYIVAILMTVTFEMFRIMMVISLMAYLGQ